MAHDFVYEFQQIWLRGSQLLNRNKRRMGYLDIWVKFNVTDAYESEYRNKKLH
jgi:hypothetical protein